MGVLEMAKELDRQVRSQDDKYLRSFVYYFELRVPPSVSKGSTSTYIYPLVIPPENIRISEPFQMTKTYGNGGGLWLEEGGIIGRSITIKGTTGFRPRHLPRVASPSAVGTIAVPYEGKSHSRNVAFNIVEALSGQRHFQFLQDAVFRTYGDLKRDPTTNEGTELFFHNPKDDEHWAVAPVRFDGERNAKRTTLYPYDIELFAYAPASTAGITFSEDEEVLKQISDGIRMLRYGVSLVRASILDLGNTQNELRMLVKGIGGVIDDAGSIAGAAESFLEGTTSLISVPLSYVSSTISLLESSLSAFQRAVTLGSSEDVHDSVLNILRRIGDGLNVIATYPTFFQKSLDAAVESFQKRADLSTTRSEAQFALSRTQPAPQSLREYNQLGTDLLPGDYLRARDELGLGRNTPRYTSAEERVIESGDTLPNLAARYLGDARQWKFIAVFNSLRPPFISNDGLPGTLGIGDKILIPSFAKPATSRSPTSIIGVKPEQPGEEHALGVDLLLTLTDNGQYDLTIDTEHGSTDLKRARGRDNLSQGLRSRLKTERGHDTLYKTLGVQRMVGLGLTVIDRELAQLRLVEGIQADPRISAVRSLSFLNDPTDALAAEIEAEVRGISRSEKILVRSP